MPTPCPLASSQRPGIARSAKRVAPRMDDQALRLLKLLGDFSDAEDIKIARVGAKWLAWVEPSVHLTGSGESALAAMKALVERMRRAKLHSA